MAHLIDKDALLAEIENRIKKYILLQQIPEMSDLQEELQNKIDCLNSIKGYIINTLEVKDMDLQSEIDSVWNNTSDNFSEDGWKEFEEIAKHFFELGLKVQKEE